MLSGMKKLKAEREHERTSLNVFNLDVQWRELLREAKTKELQLDLHRMKQSFMKAVDYKDAAIAALQRDIEQTEVQNLWTACNHMRALEELISVEQQRSEKLRQLYEKDLNELKDLYTETKKDVETKFKNEMSWFQDLEFIEKTIFEDLSEKSKMQFIIMQEEIDEAILKEKASVLETFDSHISTTWKQFQSALLKYLEDADAMERLFAEIKDEYKEAMLDWQHDRNVTEELRRSIPQLKAQIEERKKDQKERIQKVLMGNEDFYNEAANLKESIARVQRHDKASLTNLIKNSSSALRELQRLVDKGEKIMRLYQRCTKLEAEIAEIPGAEEPVLSAEELEETERGTRFSLPETVNLDEGCQYVGLLEGFWARHNKVYLKNLALQRELGDLQLLNRQLRSDMSNFLKSVADGKVESRIMTKTEHKPMIQEAALLATKLTIPKY